MKIFYQKILAVIMMSSFLAFPAYAYLDPGTGSMIIQGVIATVASIGFVLKLYWHRVLIFLRIRKAVQIEEDREGEDKPL